MSKIENAAPATATEVIDLTQDVYATREALLAAHERINTLSTRFTLTDRALDASLDYIATLAAKAAALDALVEAVGQAAEALGATATLDADAYQNTPGVDRAWESRITAFSEVEDALTAALKAAKLAQVSK